MSWEPGCFHPQWSWGIAGPQGTALTSLIPSPGHRLLGPPNGTLTEGR